jgi:2-polyprenyl-6-methoxyphenol hydroxylase-like FAD-dependent oxidoreductase
MLSDEMEHVPMRSPLSTEVPVLVVGAGPAGLAAALTLARHGIRAAVVERRPGLPSLPRATGVSTRTMELMRAWGVEEAVRAGANDVDWRLWWCETLAEAAAGWPVFVGLPTSEQSAVLSPTGPACVPQDHLEPVLEQRLRELGHPGVERGTELVSLEPAGDGVVARLRGADGEERDVHAGYVVAADGAHSTIRRLLGIEMHGVERTDDRIAALFRAPLWDVVGERRFGLYWTTAGGGNAVLPAGLPDRWLLGTEWRPQEERLEDYDEARVGAIIRAAAGVPRLPLRIERIAAVQYAALVADRYRDDRVFLVGDAAHRGSPRGGTGLNTAIHDAHDLGWRLAWVLQGWSGSGLLDGYELERRPVAEHNVRRGADPDGSVSGAGDAIAADLGGRMPHVWVTGPDGGRCSTLDLLGPGLTLFAARGAERWDAAAAIVGTPPPLAVRRLEPLAARALGVAGRGALLVREDGVPVATWATDADAPAALCRAIDAATALPAEPVLMPAI